MAPRSFWKGYLKLSLVTCPVAMMPATSENEKVRFHTLNEKARLYDGRVPPEADLVTYWFDKARSQIEAEKTRRVGLVATNSIRGGANRRVLDRIVEDLRIFEAWSDEPWIVEGAAVRVSLVCFGEGSSHSLFNKINVDLTANQDDLTRAVQLSQNRSLMSQGIKFGGPFEITGSQAAELLLCPLNVNGRPNSDVLRLWSNGGRAYRRACLPLVH